MSAPKLRMDNSLLLKCTKSFSKLSESSQISLLPSLFKTKKFVFLRHRMDSIKIETMKPHLSLSNKFLIRKEEYFRQKSNVMQL